jgi:hypothetical protein
VELSGQRKKSYEKNEEGVSISEQSKRERRKEGERMAALTRQRNLSLLLEPKIDAQQG